MKELHASHKSIVDVIDGFQQFFSDPLIKYRNLTQADKNKMLKLTDICGTFRPSILF